MSNHSALNFVCFILSSCFLGLTVIDTKKFWEEKKYLKKEAHQSIKQFLIFLFLFLTIGGPTVAFVANIPELDISENTEQKNNKLQELYRKKDFSADDTLENRPTAIDNRIVVIKCKIYPRTIQTNTGISDSIKRLIKRSKDLQDGTNIILSKIHKYNSQHKLKYHPTLVSAPSVEIHTTNLDGNYEIINKLLNESISLLEKQPSPYKKKESFNLIDLYTLEIINELSTIESFQKMTLNELRKKEDEMTNAEKLLGDAKIFLEEH